MMSYEQDHADLQSYQQTFSKLDRLTNICDDSVLYSTYCTYTLLICCYQPPAQMELIDETSIGQTSYCRLT